MLNDLETWVKLGELKMQTIKSHNPNFPGWMIYDGRNVLRLRRSTETEVLAWLAERGYERHSDYLRKLRGA